MNRNILISSLLVIIILNIAGCEKNDPYAFNVGINLVNESGKETNVFDNGDSIIFKFYLTNNSGDDAFFERPCFEFSNFLNIYKKDTEGVYQYYGKPSFNCTAALIILDIKNRETTLLATLPWSEELGWPEKQSGEFYVGDTLKLNINDERHDFEKRLYFEIK